MGEHFEWKAEIAFRGTAEEFARFTGSLQKLTEAGTVSFHIPEEGFKPIPFPGFWPIEPEILLGKTKLAKLLQGRPRLKIELIRDIRGGIRTPHLHLADEIVLLDRATFKTVVSEAAAGLAARRLEQATDYVQVMVGINALASSPVPQPVP